MEDTVGHLNVANRAIELKRMKKQSGRPTNAVVRVFTEFTERSSIHGVQYLGEKKLHWSERFWWIMSLAISVIVCSYFIHQVWMKLTPVVITFNEEATHVSDIEFPTITICNELKILPSAVNYSHYMNIIEDSSSSTTISDEIIQQMYAITRVCRNDSRKVDDYVTKRNIQIDRNFVPLLENISVDFLKVCEYNFNGTQPCRKTFSPILTDYGLCYTINNLSTEKIYKNETLADDFLRVKSAFTQPFRMERARQRFVIDSKVPKREIGIKGICFNPWAESSVAIFVHPAEEMPDLSKFHYFIPWGWQGHISLRANIMSTDEDVIESYKKDERKCIAESENELKFFRTYTQSNCHIDVIVNEIIKRCKCAATWMPRSNDVRICSGSDFDCVTGIENQSSNLTKKCLPACKSTTYDYDIFPSRLADSLLYSSDDIPIRISISFENDQYFGMKRSESYGKIDFLAGVGGIVGLFMGISFLSIIEVLYYPTLRAFCNVRHGRSAETQLEHLNPEIGQLEVKFETMPSEHKIIPMDMNTELKPSEN